MDQSTEISIPDLLLLTPFPWDGTNPHHSPDNRESTEWILKYSVFSDHRRDKLDSLRIELFGAYTYPYADAEGMRLAADCLMFLHALDEFTDVQDTEGVKATRNIFVNALKGQYEDEAHPITLFTKDFMTRLSRIASPEVLERFVSHSVAYIDATAKEPGLRVTNKTLPFDEYIQLRRDNGGVFSCFDLIEAALRVTLPAGVFEDPNFQQICCATNDMICLANDIYSYAVEQSRDLDLVNYITTIKHERGVSTQEAVDIIADHYKKLGDTVNTCKQNIRSFGPEADDAIRAYIHGMEQWVYGYIVWSFDTPRYFGKEHEEVKRTMTVKVMQHKSLD